MNKFLKVQSLILCSIVNSCMLRSDKIDCLNYLFWNLCWDFDIDTLKQNIHYPSLEEENAKIKL